MVDMDTLLHRDALSRFGYALSDSTRNPGTASACGRPRGIRRTSPTRSGSRVRFSRITSLACADADSSSPSPEGRRTRYELADPRIGDTLGQLMDLVLAVDDPTLCPKSDAEGCC